MDKHWDFFMKMGIVHPMAFPQTLRGEGPIVETLKMLAEDDFFSAVDVTYMNAAQVRKEAADILMQSRLTVTFAAQCKLLVEKADLNSEDGGERKRAVGVVKECVEQAKELGATRLCVLSGSDPGSDKRKEAAKHLLDSLREICGYGKQAGLPVCLKVFDREIEKKSLIGPAQEAKAVAEEIRKDFPDFGLVHDLSHIPLLFEKPRDILPGIKDYLVAMHMGNCVLEKGHPLYGDQHPLFGIPGGVSDTQDLADYIQVLFDIGFLGSGKRPVVGFEMKPPQGVSSEMMFANAKRTFKDAWMMVKGI